jgi:uncharacterized protein (TIGR02271 family)
MLGNRFGSESKRVEHGSAVIALFRYGIDARRALDELHERDFTSDEIAAAFRPPANSRAEADEVSVPMKGNSKWFGQLREIYRGDDSGKDRGGVADAAPQTATREFEDMLAQIDHSPQGVADRDLDRAAAIVTVRAGARNEEARTLLEQRGARIVHGRHDHDSLSSAELPPPANVDSTPFNSPPPVASDHVQLFGEVLRVRKEKVSTGDVRVRKEAVTHMETVQVPVTREHLVVEHSDENGRADAEPAIRIPLSEERVHVDKDTVLREEYKVGKREVTRNESLTEAVRRERLLIDDATAKTND